MKPQSVVFATPYLDQNYSVITDNWNQISPRPEKWIGEIGSYIPAAHNRIVRRFLEETTADRLLILEYDMAVHPKIVARARTHTADIVTGTYVGRRPPYNPLIYQDILEDGTAVNLEPNNMARLIDEGHRGIPKEVPIAAAGTGIISVHRKVLEAIPDPWFEPSPVALRNKEFDGHDLFFCSKAKALGFSMSWDTAESMRAIHVGWEGMDIDRWIERLRREALSLR